MTPDDPPVPSDAAVIARRWLEGGLGSRRKWSGLMFGLGTTTPTGESLVRDPDARMWRAAIASALDELGPEIEESAEFIHRYGAPPPELLERMRLRARYWYELQRHGR